ncbi:Magnesium transporter CorA-like family protein [Citrus sinensis]|uniref:Magnesium transporter CorA-like family protein n=1 Tax=Citrus sinensis TaxID=2711 RepID=A0ACB8LBS9_CITSI|nr:Magnesium transporter CorA-like family protein [Citrus sinensis]
MQNSKSKRNSGSIPRALGACRNKFWCDRVPVAPSFGATGTRRTKNLMRQAPVAPSLGATGTRATGLDSGDGLVDRRWGITKEVELVERSGLITVVLAKSRRKPVNDGTLNGRKQKGERKSNLSPASKSRKVRSNLGTKIMEGGMNINGFAGFQVSEASSSSSHYHAAASWIPLIIGWELESVEVKCNMSDAANGHSVFVCNNGMKKPETQKIHLSRDSLLGGDLWTDGLICAFEFVRGHKNMVKSKPGSKVEPSLTPKVNGFSLSKSSPVIESAITIKDKFDEHDFSEDCHVGHLNGRENFLPRSYWIPIGWDRISQLVQSVQIDAGWNEQPFDFPSEEDDVTVADLAAPYWERPVGPTWCVALRDESKLISDRMKHLLYEVPVRVAGGLLFELLGQSAGDPLVDEDDVPIVLRSWQAQKILLTALHVKGSTSNINVLGIMEVQELLAAGGSNIPRTIYEVVAHLACRLAQWDDRLFRKSIFGAADEIELKFMNRRTHEDMHLVGIILNQEIRRLSTQVIRVKWSLHARDEIVFELLQHLKGNLAWALLERMRKSTREMIEEQEAVRGRLFTIQDVMQSTVRSWLQDRSLRVTHNLGVFGGCGLILSIITGLFGINVDGIPGARGSPYAFALFSGILFLLGVVLIAIGLLYLGLKKPILDEHVEVRKLELEELVKMFEQEAESHAQVRKSVPDSTLPPTVADLLPDGASYVLIS